MAETRTRDDAKVNVGAGYFNRRGQILALTGTTDDGQGGQTYTYSAPINVWMHVDTGKPGRFASDNLFAGQLYPIQHATIGIRYASGEGVTPKSQVLYNNRKYWVESVKNVQEANVLLEMYCAEYQSAGMP